MNKWLIIYKKPVTALTVYNSSIFSISNTIKKIVSFLREQKTDLSLLRSPQGG